ncbi:MAG: hypothetical protein KJN62_10215 [Deltaproteobacteria bacterium]|nr:hypothetical protein [Deltaproteobacteria bacterium]
MNRSKIEKWKKIHKSGRNRFIWFRGVLGWGLIVAILWSIAMSYSKKGDTGFWNYLIIALFIFPVGGYLWGSWMWKRCEYMLYRLSSQNTNTLFGDLDPSSFTEVTILPKGKILTATMRPAIKLAWFAVTFFSVLTLLAFLLHSPMLSIPFVIFIGLSVYVLLVSGKIEISSKKIVLDIPIGYYEIAWDEIKSIETDIQRTSLIFIGKNKRLVLAGPGWWGGQDKKMIISFLNSEIARRSINIKLSQKTLIKSSKNSRRKIRVEK